MLRSLRYVSDTSPGIHRLRCGKGFRYRDAEGRAVRDSATLERIRSLAIPPAYENVWICASAHGHLQASGRDARGRKQYRYHPQWRQQRDARKFERLVDFGKAQPRLHRRLRRDLSRSGFPREKVLAIVVTVMATTLMRVGNRAYTRDNGSYGLTTLRSRHARLLRHGLRLQFQGKSGTLHEVDIEDRRLVRLLRAMHELPGQHLFQYLDEDGDSRPVESADVNDYLRDAMDGEFSAKDFRTWGATLAAFRELAAIPAPSGDETERELADICNEVVRTVAKLLGNTEAVCRKSYIDPCVFEGWRDGNLHKAAAKARGARQWETAALRYLVRAHRAAAK